jgi:hypothetical protein
MKSELFLDRRRFLAAAATAAGTMAVAPQESFRLQAADGAVRETKDFFFRLAPEGPYTDSQRDSRAFGFDDGKMYLSDDNAHSWA